MNSEKCAVTTDRKLQGYQATLGKNHAVGGESFFIALRSWSMRSVYSWELSRTK